MVTLLVARHGKTFAVGETPLRIGKRSDLALSESGVRQAKNLGQFLVKKYPPMTRVIVSTLQRTQQTARLAVPYVPWEIDPLLDEIDYGVDEGQPEAAVVARVGAAALQRWDQEALPVAGWHVDPAQIIRHWQALAQRCVQDHARHTVTLVITSNGIARFAPQLSAAGGVWPQPSAALKLHTGAISAFEYRTGAWHLNYWNHRPTSGEARDFD